MSANDGATIASKPKSWSAQGACSRDEPHPKFRPVRRIRAPSASGRFSSKLGLLAPVPEQELAEAGALDPLQELLRDDLVGVDVGAVEYGRARRDAPERLHETAAEVANVDESTLDRGRRGHRRRHEMRAPAAALPALEVPVRGRRATLAWAPGRPGSSRGTSSIRRAATRTQPPRRSGRALPPRPVASRRRTPGRPWRARSRQPVVRPRSPPRAADPRFARSCRSR